MSAKPLDKRGSARRAFTLVELLVVIGIIAVLLSLLMGSLAKVRRAARELKCLSNLRQLGIAYTMYVGDNKGKSFYFFEDGTVYWTALLRPYASNIDAVRFCPDAEDLSGWGSATTAWNVYSLEGSYGMNLWCCRNIYFGNAIHASGWMYAFDQPDKTIDLPAKQDTEVPVFADSTWVGGWPWDTDSPPGDLYTGGGFGNPGGHLQRFCTNRHRHRTNLVFLDGHASSVVLEDLWRVKWNATFQYSTVVIPNH